MFTPIRALSNEIYYFINVVIITSKIALILKNVWRRKRKSHSRLKVAHFPWRAAAVSAGRHPKRKCQVSCEVCGASFPLGSLSGLTWRGGLGKQSLHGCVFSLLNRAVLT